MSRIRAGLHGVTQGILGGFSGQEFGQGFLIGAVSSMAGSMFQGVSPKFANSTSGMIGFSGLAGGVTAELTGGDFLKGFATGVTIGALNHGMNHVLKRTLPSFKKLWDAYPKDNDDGSHAHPSRDGYKNQCAIRIGYAFKKAGEDISSYDKTNQTSEGYPRWSKGFAMWIEKNYEPSPMKMSQSEFNTKYFNTAKGIIYLEPPKGGTGHIDLINNGKTGSGYYLATQVWYWPLK